MEPVENAVIRDLLNRKITVSVAEWTLRAKYGSGQTGVVFQEIYNYLDELAGVLDGKVESDEDIKSFREFLDRRAFCFNLE